MRTLFILICFLFLAAAPAQGCDRCGCSLSGHYLSALPQYQRHVVGARWYYRGFESSHHDGAFSNERFHSLELWGRFYPVKRLQLLAVLPVNFFTQQAGADRLTRNGLGDAVLLANYNLLQQAWGADKKWRQAFYLGGGVKLPTGKFDPELIEQEINPNMQPGTGTFDWLGSASYTLRYANWGLNADMLLRFSRENSAEYRFGNRLNINGRLFYWAKTGKSSWLPSVGIAHEWAAEDCDSGVNLSDTGGFCEFGTIGLDWYYGNLALSAAWNIPVHQYLGSGHIDAGQRVQLGMAYIF